MKSIIFCLIFMFMISSSVMVYAAVIRVPADQPAIQYGINAAQHNDTVLVADGTYTGPNNRNLTFFGKAITVRSENGPTNCIIDCQGLGRGVVFDNNESVDSVFEGFTIREGYINSLGSSGGGIVINAGSSPTISNCIIRECVSAQESGGGIYCGGSATIIYCSFIQNNAFRSGGGIHIAGLAPTLIDCYFLNNSALDNAAMNNRGGGACVISNATFADCRFVNNLSEKGGAVYVGNKVIMKNCLFMANLTMTSTSTEGGGAVYLHVGTSETEFWNCSFRGNDSLLGSSIYNHDHPAQLFNCILRDSTSGL